LKKVSKTSLLPTKILESRQEWAKVKNKDERENVLSFSFFPFLLQSFLCLDVDWMHCKKKLEKKHKKIIIVIISLSPALQ